MCCFLFGFESLLFPDVFVETRGVFFQYCLMQMHPCPNGPVHSSLCPQGPQGIYLNTLTVAKPRRLICF